ncbi:hypothetical protein M2262_004796 [Pseudomonas sp. BIGb0408]|uniref:Uncharacterized protein n=2 Tax=Pseudomonadaceae TaxID=135621 RepID=A0A1G8DZ78_9GAMM|nr:hypothetical protein RU08_03585 [Pseudomonas fulva]MCW2294746.1 hypothetical protein [Pseudomonas sp. BIGb0408]NYH75980.1 hypothetical protein [Pseudomonas flavescens]SDH62927.1 hypothetical protein SAMN05216588_10616 [Pseudomonas flavescens]
MVTMGFLIALVAWIWSVSRGIQVSLLCVVLNFMFPPISQGIFALYEQSMRPPLLIMAVGLGMMYLGGGLKVS